MADMDRYRDLFLEESRKELERAEELLLAESGPDREALDAVFREIHSLKGMAGSMGYSSMADLAHRLEDRLGRWRAAGNPLGQGEVALCLRVCDRLCEMREEVAAGRSPGVEWLDLAAELTSRSAEASDGELTARISISADCGSPSARAYVILLRFRELDPAVRSIPTEEEILRGEPVSQLELNLHRVSAADVEAVCATLTEVESLSLEGRSERKGPESRGPDSAPAKVAGNGADDEGAVAKPADEDSRVHLPETVQAPVRILDEFVDLVGEMTIARSHLEDAARGLGSDILREEVNRLGGLIRAFHEGVMALRMLPFSLATTGLKRLVRDLSSRLGKEVDVRVFGDDIGMDKSILLQIADPLMHLLRNALDHGLETAEERQRKGKPARGLIEVRAERTKNRVEVSVADDGRGIDVEVLRRKAVERGVFTDEESQHLGSREVLSCLFRPGFSTRDAVTDVSGRGVGLDVVKTKVDALGGAIEVGTVPGARTEFRLSLPLSVAIVPVLMVVVGATTLAVPVASVVRTVEALPEDVRESDGRHVFLTAHGQVPILSLARIVRIHGKSRFDRMPLVLLQTSGGVTGLAVDRFVREEDLFIKPLRGPIRALPGLSGYSVLGDGSLVFLLDPATLLATRTVRLPSTTSPGSGKHGAPGRSSSCAMHGGGG